MVSDVNVGECLRAGGVYDGIKGASPSEIYKNLSTVINLPDSVSPKLFYEALCAREAILSTAVGNGVAIPHSQQPLLKNPEEQRIFICYLDEPIDMQAIDGKRVTTMIIPLSCSAQSHLHIISRLAHFLTKADFRKALDLRFGLNELYQLMSVL